MKKFTLCILLVIVFIVKPLKNIAQAANTQDSLVMVELYDSTYGSTYWTTQTNWLTTAPLSTWYGLTVVGGRVTQISLPYNNLAGNIPPDLGNLSALTYLDLDNNLIGDFTEDSIPASLGNLSNLTHLDLSNNELGGNIPSSLGNLSQLTYLNLYYQTGGFYGFGRFNNGIPSSFGNLTNLQYLNISECLNYPSPPIPSSLGNLTKLTHLELEGGGLSGSIPASFGNLINLNYLDLSSNLLTGSIPSSLGKLSQMQYLSLYSNQFSGTVPSSLDSFTHLYNLTLYDNALTFDGMEGIATAYNSFATYSTQALIPITYNTSANQLSVSAGGTLSNNTYNWYRNDTLILTTPADSIYTNPIPGTYYVTITNSVANKLVLQSSSVTVGIVPLTLISFAGELLNGNTFIKWQSVNEINTLNFTVERCTDGKDFTAIGSINAFNTAGVHDYNFTDNRPPAGKAYYRLTMKDKNGYISYSNIILITNGVSGDGIAVFPNPVKDILTIKGLDIATGNLISVIDASGKTIMQSVLTGSNNQLNIQKLAAGTYYLRIKTNNKIIIQKLVKE